MAKVLAPLACLAHPHLPAGKSTREKISAPQQATDRPIPVLAHLCSEA